MKYTSAYADQRADRKGKPWVGHLKYRDEATGRWRQVSKTFGDEVRTQKQADQAVQEWRIEMELEAASAKPQLPGATTTVPEYMESYISTLEKSESIERHTARDYRTILKRVEAAFTGVSMCDATTAQVQAWEQGMTDEGLAASTVTKHHRVLNAVFKHAVAVRDIDWNPCAAVKVPKRKRTKPNSLTMEGYARLAATVRQLEPSPVVTAATIALFTGMREGEVCALRWKDYDSKNRTITVQASVGKDGGKTYVKSTKTDQVRTVPVPDGLADMLARRRRAMVEELESYGVSLSASEFSDLFIIGSADGNYYSPLFLCKVWREFSETFGLWGTQGKRITFHDLRHTFASVAIAAKIDVRVVSEVLGHANVAITLNTYADALPEAKAAVADRIGELIRVQGDVKPYAELTEAGTMADE